jgi:hypothetical protein
VKIFLGEKSETQPLMQKLQSGVMQFISAGMVTHYFLRNVLPNLVLSKSFIAVSMSIAHCSRNPRNLLKFFHDGENSLLKSLRKL